jgi:hypothetical protein
MVKLHFAHTSPINPPGATPVLTPAQVWAGLQRKIRFAQEFVPIIESCTVLSDENGVVTREVVFKPGAAPKEKAKEVVRGFGTCWVDFQQEDGSVVKNIISDSGEGGAENLHMTYAFEMDFPQFEEGSEGAEKQLCKMKGVSFISL